MNRSTFLASLRQVLREYPKDTIDRTVDYYDEMICDRIEDGLSEDEAVSAMGPVEDILRGMPPLSPPVVKQAPRRMKAWEIWLLALGFPVWFPLLVAFACVALAVFIVLQSCVICLFAAELSLAAGAICGIFMAVYDLFGLHIAQALAKLGAASLCAGLTILLFRPILRSEKALLRLMKRIAGWLIRKFSRKAA